MKSVVLKLDKVTPYPNNPRINEDAIFPVMESIKQFGYVTPIVVDKKYVIICGHTRFEALKRLGFVEARVIVSTMTAEQAKEFRLVDNKTAELAEWDKDRLVAELRLIEGDAMASFFRNNELDKLMGDLDRIDGGTPTQDQIDKVAERQKTHFKDNAQKLADSVVTCDCVHCKKQFSFDIV